MSVERLSSIMPSSTQVLASVPNWGAKLVTPLGFSLMSKDGMIKLAGRVYWIVGLVIAAVLVARKYGYLTGRVTPPDSSSTNPTEVSKDLPMLSLDIGDDIGEIGAELTNPENSAEDSIEELPWMPGDIVDDANQDDEAFVGDLPNQRIEQELDQHRQQMDRHRQQMDRHRQEMEQLRREREQRRGQMEQMMEQMERMNQRLGQIKLQLRGHTETEQSR